MTKSWISRSIPRRDWRKHHGNRVAMVKEAARRDGLERLGERLPAVPPPRTPEGKPQSWSDWLDAVSTACPAELAALGPCPATGPARPAWRRVIRLVGEYAVRHGELPPLQFVEYVRSLSRPDGAVRERVRIWNAICRLRALGAEATSPHPAAARMICD